MQISPRQEAINKDHRLAHDRHYQPALHVACGNGSDESVCTSGFVNDDAMFAYNSRRSHAIRRSLK